MTDLTVSGTDAQSDMPIKETDKNPFELIAYLLYALRHSLEDWEDLERPPRWMRIARVRETDGTIADAVKIGMDKFADAISWLTFKTVRVKELLTQTDGVLALTEVAWDLVTATTDENFQTGIRQLTGSDDNMTTLDKVNNALVEARKYLAYVPNPADIDVIGRELYKLLSIEQVEPARNPNWTVDETASRESPHISPTGTGKLRLIQWALGEKGIINYGLGTGDKAGDEHHYLMRLGSLRLWQADKINLPPESSLSLPGGNQDMTVFHFLFGDDKESGHKDVVELNAMLGLLGYNQPPVQDNTVFDANLSTRLRYFQEINELPITGEPDNHTVNRLLHLDYEAKNIKRAKPFDPAMIDKLNIAKSGRLPVINPDADHPGDEGIEPSLDKGYGYYIAGHRPDDSDPNWQGGWLGDAELGPRFVGVQSRAIITENGEKWYDYRNGRRRELSFLSEGEAASGKYFFAAALSEPWVPARLDWPTRSDEPAPDQPSPIYSAISSGTATSLYQWLSLESLKANVASHLEGPHDLHLSASVLQRSLYKESSGQPKQVDSGRIGIEVYDPAGFTAGLKSPRPDPDSTPSMVAGYTDHFPGEAFVQAAQTLPELTRKHTWVFRKAMAVVPADRLAEAVAVLVVLEGRLRHGRDIDAYFDDVNVRWDFRPSPVS